MVKASKCQTGFASMNFLEYSWGLAIYVLVYSYLDHDVWTDRGARLFLLCGKSFSRTIIKDFLCISETIYDKCTIVLNKKIPNKLQFSQCIQTLMIVNMFTCTKHSINTKTKDVICFLNYDRKIKCKKKPRTQPCLVPFMTSKVSAFSLPDRTNT